MRSIDFPFIAGVDEGESKKQLPLPRLVRAENLRATKLKQLRKIRGTAAIGTGTVDADAPDPIGPVRLAAHNDQLIAAGEGTFWSLLEGVSPSTWREVESAPDLTLTSKLSLAHYVARNVVAVGVASITAFTVYAWVTHWNDGSDHWQLHGQTVDNTTGAATGGTVIDVTEDEGLTHLKVLAIGSKVVLFWGQSNQIRYYEITTALTGPVINGPVGTFLLSGTITTDDQWMDIAPHAGGYLVAYYNGTNIIVDKRSSTHVQAWSATLSFTGTVPRLGVVGDLTHSTATWAVVIATDLGSSLGRLEVRSYSDAPALQFTYSTDSFTPVIYKVACSSHDSGAYVCLVREETGASQSIRTLFVQGASATQGSEILDSHIAGKPFSVGARSYIPIQYMASQANSAFLLLSHELPMSTGLAAPEVRMHGGRAEESLPNPASSTCYANGVFHVMIPVLDRFSSPIILQNPTGTIREVGEAASGTEVINVVGADGFRFAYRARDRYQTARVGPYTFFGGGTVLAFDGRRITELGFSNFPVATVNAVASGGTMVAGTYTYGFVYEWIDFAGNRHQSAPYIVQEELTVSNGSMQILLTRQLVATLKKWRRSGDDGKDVYVAIYRSEANGSQLFRLEGTGVDPFPSAFPPFAQWVDTESDAAASLTSRELLYAGEIGAGELDNVPPPPSRIVIAHDDRLIGINDEDPSQLWYTKQIFPGSSPAWNESLVVQLEQPAVALASQDGNLIVFSATAIWTVTGRPADNTGASTSYEPPQRMSAELGCVNARSVCVAPFGIFFESHRGIYVLPRGGSDAVFIGKQVEDTLGAYPVITSAAHVAGESTVLFSCVTAEALSPTPTGRVLAYQYDMNQWFVRTYNSKAVSSLAVHGGNLALGIYDNSAALTTWREDSGFDHGDASYVSTVVETADIRLGGPAGYHSLGFLSLLGERAGTCQVRIRESVDGGVTWGTAVTWTLSSAELELVRRYQTKTRKSGLHRFEIVELQSGSADSEGLVLHALKLEGDALSRASRLVAASNG